LIDKNVLTSLKKYLGGENYNYDWLRMHMIGLFFNHVLSSIEHHIVTKLLSSSIVRD